MLSRSMMKRILLYTFYSLLMMVAGIACLGIIFYASGYRYNFTTGHIEKTGLLVLRELPDGAQALINGNQTKLRNTRILPALGALSYSTILLPGEYEVRIQKEGFHTYSEKIIIQPELITELEDIYLVPTNPDIKSSTIVGDYSASDNGEKVLYRSSSSDLLLIYTRDFSAYPYTNVLEPTDIITAFSWGKNSRFASMIVQRESISDILLVDTENQSAPYFLSERFSFIPKPQAQYLVDANQLYVLSGDTLHLLDVQAKTSNIVDVDVANITSAGDYLFYIKKDGDVVAFHTTLLKKQTLSLPPPHSLKNVPFLAVKTPGTYYIHIGDRLIATDATSYVRIIDAQTATIAHGQTSSNNSLVYIRTPSELWILDDSTKNGRRLITRTSETPLSLHTLTTAPYTLYCTDRAIKIVKNNGTNNITLLERTQQDIAACNLTKNNQIVFYTHDAQEKSATLHTVQLP